MNKDDIEKLIDQYNINVSGYKITDDLSVDVDGDVDLSHLNLHEIPIKFGRVTGDFLCNNNFLTNLKNAPKYIGGTMYCHNNYLKTLIGGPIKVNYDYDCYYNRLTNLKGCPNILEGSLNCSNNYLTSLEGSPKHIKDNFISYSNTELYNLDDITENMIVDGYYNFSGTPLSFFCNKWSTEDVMFFKELSPVRFIDNKWYILMDRLEMFLLVRDKTFDNINMKILKDNYIIYQY